MPQALYWQKKATSRLGAQYRSNESRLIYIKDLGWFIRLRGEFNSVSGITVSNGTAGPFVSQELAFAYLRDSLKQEQSSNGNS